MEPVNRKPKLMPELTVDTLTLGLIWFVVFLFSTTCHEGAHALVAKLGGDPDGERPGDAEPHSAHPAGAHSAWW